MNKETKTRSQEISEMLNSLRDLATLGMVQIGEYRELMWGATTEEVKIGVLLYMARRVKGIVESADYQLEELNEHITKLQQDKYSLEEKIKIRWQKKTPPNEDE